MEYQLQHIYSKSFRLLELPRELRDKIYGFIIPADQLYIFLLSWEVKGSFLFNRGYGFPTFQASIFRACSQVYSEAMEMWCRTSHFRLDMGECLGSRMISSQLTDGFISKITRCELHIVLPFYPGADPAFVPGNKVHLAGPWMLRCQLKRLFGVFTQGGNLRQMILTVRDKQTGCSYTSSSDHVPMALENFANGPLMQPVKEMRGYACIIVLEKEAKLRWRTSYVDFIKELGMLVERRLLQIAIALADVGDDLRTFHQDAMDTYDPNNKIYNICHCPYGGESPVGLHSIREFHGEKWFLVVY